MADIRVVTGDSTSREGGPDSQNRLDGSGGDGIPAAEYCERIVDFFCPFYLRCGRIAEADLASCRATFSETCNAVYEPAYIALEQAGHLELSAAGIAACKAHLATVPCEQQLLDLKGPCKSIWRGKRKEGEGCGINTDSFICDAHTTCVVAPSLCGTCGKAAKTGAACGDGVRCRFPDRCVAGSCVAPALPGQSCGDERNCISGASCVAGSCIARQFAKVGDSCGGNVRCPYRSACIAKICVRTAKQGESCADRPCASGRCDQGKCIPFGLPGQPCSDGPTCLSKQCVGGSCGQLLSRCLNP